MDVVGQRMRDWNSVTALGAYLGVLEDGQLATRAAGDRAADSLLASIQSAACTMVEHCPSISLDALTNALEETDFHYLAQSGGDRREALARDVHRRLAGEAGDGEISLSYEAFSPYFQEYLLRIGVTLQGAMCVLGLKREVISLESPGARECIGELQRLPCRKYGEGVLLTLSGQRFVTSLSKYVQSLLKRYELSAVDSNESEAISDMMGRLAAYPHYYRMMGRERRLEAARPLLAVTARLQALPAAKEKADLTAALGILLFNILPSQGLIKFLTIHRPGQGNRYLLYEYNALLALNFLLMGRIELAAAFGEKAFDAAPDPDLRAYARMLEGCVQLHRRNFGAASGALENGLALAGDRRIRSLIAFYLGIVRFDAGEIGRALNCFRDARLGATDEADVMAAYNNMGTCHMLLGNLGQALRAFEEVGAIGAYSGRGTIKFLRSVASGNAGIVYASMIEHDLALECFRNALRASREIRNARGVADQLLNIGLTYKGKREYKAAVDHFVSALGYAYSVDYPEGALFAYREIRQTIALQGRHGDEAAIYRAAVRRHPGIAKLLGEPAARRRR